jgi:amino acid adenylation domain-containing protein
MSLSTNCHAEPGMPELSPLPAMHELVRRSCERYADRIAIETLGQPVRYAELAQRVDAMRSCLEQRIAPGSVVAVVGHRSAEAIVAALACWSLGCVLMNVDDGLPDERRRLMLDSVPPAATVRCAATTQIELAQAAPATLAPFDTDHAYIAFTSGSTGRPKAILGSHRGLSHFVLWQSREFDIGAHDRFAHLTNLSFDVWLRDAFTPLASGATLCIPDHRHLGARDLFDFLDTQAITAMHVVPSVANHWINSAPARAAIATMRLAFFAGEPLEGVLVRRWQARFPSCEVINLYGPTETTLAKHFRRVPSQPCDGVQPVGHPIPGSATHILDEQLRPCAEGIIGEICIETHWRSHGYLSETGLRAPFVDFQPSDGPARSVYRTGDRGRRNASGEIEIHGRLDDQVKINGVRIELLEVKSAIASFPGVRDVFVCAAGTGYERRLVAVLEAAQDVTVPLMAHLRERLPAAMVPAHLLNLSALPRLPNGKLDRTALSRLATASPAASAPPQPIRSMGTTGATAAEKLESLWRTVLRSDSVHPHRNFFESGGTSLTIVELHARIEATFGIRLPIVRLFEHATLASQAAMLASDADRDTAVAPRAHTALHAIRARTLGARGRRPRQLQSQWSERQHPDAQA